MIHLLSRRQTQIGKNIIYIILWFHAGFVYDIVIFKRALAVLNTHDFLKCPLEDTLSGRGYIDLAKPRDLYYRLFAKINIIQKQIPSPLRSMPNDGRINPVAVTTTFLILKDSVVLLGISVYVTIFFILRTKVLY